MEKDKKFVIILCLVLLLTSALDNLMGTFLTEVTIGVFLLLLAIDD